MIELKTLQDLSDRLAAVLPPAMGQVRDELRENFRMVLQARLAELDLVTRDQFEAQKALLNRSRQKLDEIEQRLRALEDPR